MNKHGLFSYWRAIYGNVSPRGFPSSRPKWNEIGCYRFLRQVLFAFVCFFLFVAYNLVWLIWPRGEISRVHTYTMTFKMHNANDHWKRCDDVYGSVVSVHDQRPINKQLFDWLWRGANYEWHHDVRHDNYLRWTIMCVRWLLVYCFLYFVVLPGIKGANSPVDECLCVLRVWVFESDHWHAIILLRFFVKFSMVPFVQHIYTHAPSHLHILCGLSKQLNTNSYSHTQKHTHAT